ncbi:MAG: hypothetical protein CMH49_06695 [Myxococcales bacterium]|nr:hypothetical protein [Myxococcales bacterium]
MSKQDRLILPKCIIRHEKTASLPSILALVNINDVLDLKENTEFLKGFTAQEMALVRSRAKGHHSLAARYAAKQAAQALTELCWTEFEIVRPVDQPPILCLRGQSIDSLNQFFTLSLTHDEPYALAYLVALKPFNTHK